MVSYKLKIQIISGVLFYTILCFTYYIYSPALSGPFFLDDFPNLEILSTLDKGATWQYIIFDNHSGLFGRIVSMSTFVFDYLRGGGGSSAFKTTNLAIHLITGCVIFWLSIELFEITSIKNHRLFASLFLVALWLTSPLFASTVLYVVQRMAQLSALFMFAGCLCYVMARKISITKQSRSRAWILLAISLFVFYPLAIFSKENGIILPLLLLLIEIVFFNIKGLVNQNKTIPIIMHGTTFVCFLGLAILIIANSKLFIGYETREFNMMQRLLTESRVLLDYLEHLILPKGDQFGLVHDDYLISESLFKPFSTFFHVLFWLFSIVVCYSLVLSNKYKLISFGLLFFILGHIVESSVFPLEIYFEHRNYLPSFGIYFTLTHLVFVLFKKFKITLLILPLPLLFGFKTSDEVYYWTTNHRLINKYYQAHPDSARAMVTMSSHLMNIKDYENASNILLELENIPNYKFGAKMQRLLLLCHQGLATPEAYLKELKTEVIKRNKIHYPIYESEIIKSLLENYASCQHWNSEGVAEFTYLWAYHFGKNSNGRIVQIVYYNASVFLSNLGYYSPALNLIDSAIQLDPNNVRYQLIKIQYLISDKRYELAEKYLQQLHNQNLPMDNWQTQMFENFNQNVSENL